MQVCSRNPEINYTDSFQQIFLFFLMHRLIIIVYQPVSAGRDYYKKRGIYYERGIIQRSGPF